MSKTTDHTAALRDVLEHVNALRSLTDSLHIVARIPIEDNAPLALSAIAHLAKFHVHHATQLLDTILSLCHPAGAAPKKDDS